MWEKDFDKNTFPEIIGHDKGKERNDEEWEMETVFFETIYEEDPDNERNIASWAGANEKEEEASVDIWFHLVKVE